MSVLLYGAARLTRATRVIVGVATAGLLAMPSPAQSQSLDRALRPAAAPDQPFRFPDITTSTLPNGLRLAVVENHALPIVAVRVVMNVDSLADPRGKEGLFALTQLMLRDGTTTRTAAQFSDAFSDLGDVVTATGFTMLSANFERALTLTSDMLMHPVFPQPALERRKATRVSAIKSLLQSPYTAPRRVLYARMFGAEHPMARSIVPSEAAIASITRDDVAAFHDRYFRPENATIVVAGDVSASRVAETVARLFADWKRGTASAAPEWVAPAAPPTTTLYLIDRPGSTQSYAYIGQLGPSRTAPDFFALETLAPILGAIPGSRLQVNLRDRHSYIYGSTPFTVTWRRAPAQSTLFGQAAIDGAKTDSALIEWVKELNAARGAQPISDAELRVGQAARIATMPSRIETTDSVAVRVAELVRDALPFDFYDRYVAGIRALTPAAVSRAASDALQPERWTIVVAGNRKTIEPGLRAAGIGPVFIVDEDGKPVPP